MHISGLKYLDIQIGNLRRAVTFVIVDDLVVPPIIDTAYQDRLVESIQCKAHWLKLIDNRSVAILDTFDLLCVHWSSPMTHNQEKCRYADAQ